LAKVTWEHLPAPAVFQIELTEAEARGVMALVGVARPSDFDVDFYRLYRELAQALEDAGVISEEDRRALAQRARALRKGSV
jgi:hypothetical protein